MDQVKIGKFIAECRKEKHITQAQLAERLGVSDRAVSKWECGRSMPDSSIMQELCGEIGINMNELFSGRRIDMVNYKEIAENNLLQMKKNEEQNNRFMLRQEVVIGMLSTVSFLILVFTAALAVANAAWRYGMIAAGIIIFGVGTYNALKIEKEAGYYECKQCGFRYVPEMRNVVMAQHIGRNRKMKCPHCGEKTWQKKVLTKE